jgi:hypothetical protein
MAAGTARPDPQENPPMSTDLAPLRTPLLAELDAELVRLEARTRVAVTGLPDSRFRENPSDGGWSIAQVFEHLCRANLAYLDGPLATARDRARARGPVDRAWRPSWLGGLFVKRITEGTPPMSAPRAFRDGLVPRERVVDEFLGTVQRLRGLMRDVDGFDLGGSVASPVAPWLRINLGDALRLAVAHSHRHLAQVERTRRAVGM